jgi:serine/threonine-protein kinase
MNAALRRHPSWHLLYSLADMELRHGRVAEARAHLEEVLQLAPGNLYGQGKLAQLELQSGSVERAEALHLELVRQSPESTQYLSNAGFAQLLLGKYAQAAESFRRAMETDPANPVFVLNLADAELLLGRRDVAMALYRRMLELSGDASGWQERLHRAEALAHLGEARAAVQETQRALKDAGGAPPALYSASLVYALVGDRSSALTNAEEALAGKISAAWFALPWFAPLREDPGFRSLLAAAAAGEPSTASRR